MKIFKHSNKWSWMLASMILVSSPSYAFTPDDITNKSSAFFSDPQFIYVNERSAESLNIVNEIMCMVAQTAYANDAVMSKNKTSATATIFSALIDEEKCGSKDSASDAGNSSQNQTSGSNSPSLVLWTVKSYRADGSSPHVVEFWVDDTEEDNGQASVTQIRAKMTITAGKSDSNPFGLFKLDFVMHPVSSAGVVDTTTIGAKGYLRTVLDSENRVNLQFSEEGGGSGGGVTESHSEATTYIRSSDGSSGSGSTQHAFSQTGGPGGDISESKSFNFAYDSNNFSRQETKNGTAGSAICLSRTNFNRNIWRYGLYDANGDRSTRSSGFPIKFNDGSKEHHGWIGFWGLHMPHGVNISNGDAVVKQSFSGGAVSNENFTVVINPGKLIKSTKETSTLGTMTNVPLQYRERQLSGPDLEFRIKWNGATFQKIAQLQESLGNRLWTDITPSALDLSAIEHDELHLFSQELGGNVRVLLHNNNRGCSETFDTGTGRFNFDCSSQLTNVGDSLPVVIYTETVVKPGDAGASSLLLACFENCPNGANSANSASASLFETQLPNFINKTPETLVAGTDYYKYDFSVGSGDQLIMRQFAGSQNLIVQTERRTDQNQFGVRANTLVDINDLTSAKMGCNFDGGAVETCAWNAGNLQTFYSWETGTQNWNKLTLLKNSSGGIVNFDAPLRVKLRRVVNSKATIYNLEYNGFGDLHGIPGRCVSWETGDPVDCGDASGHVRWLPEFSIADNTNVCIGTIDGSGVCTGTPLIVKGLEIEQQMKQDATGCTGLNLSSLTLPSINDWVNPSIGDRPTLDEPPKVVEGTVQSGL
ncbi:MAG: hypothetical protein HON94_09575 [Methylococcales bacterium]|nr:hypothetical protein [Methylococcales bacterium]